MTDPQRFFFVHLQKTAGTTLFRRLRRVFGDAAVYPDRARDGDPVASIISVEHLLDRWHERRDEIRVVTGHFPLCTAELLGGGFTTLTVLREPVERTLSYLRHHRKLTPEDRDKTLEEIYEDPFRFQGLVHNHMVKMLGLRVEDMDAGALTRIDLTPADLRRAEERLETVDVFGLQERFEQFCDDLSARFGWDLGPPEVSNRTRPVEVTDEFRTRIADDNALDVEFYEYAVRRYEAAHDARAS